MRITELLRLVWLNINQNKFKSIMTSVGIVVGAATIVMVIGIGRGGQMEVAEQFSSLNAGAIDISYEWEEEESGFGNGGFSGFGGIGGMFSFGGGGTMPGGSSSGGRGNMNFGGNSGGMPGMGAMPGGDFSGGGSDGSMLDMNEIFGGDSEGEIPDRSERSDRSERAGNSEDPESGEAPGDVPQSDASGSQEDSETREGSAEAGNEQDKAGTDTDLSGTGTSADENTEQESETEENLVEDRINQENIILTEEDAQDIALFVSGLSGSTISYSTRSSVEGGSLTDAQTYTIAGVKESYASLSKLNMEAGEFLTDQDNQTKSRVCVLGATVAKELFGSAIDAYDSTIYIDDRAYVISGVLASTGTVSAGITPDEAIFIPYETGIKYITGDSISPVITVIAEDVNALDQVIADVSTVLAENYQNAEFTFADAGSKMEAAESSNEILTLLLTAMAVIVFIVGGIGIMNVLFVSVKERTPEIGILKSLGASRRMILFEFLLESAAISLMGGVLGVGLSFLVTPIVEHYDVRVEVNTFAWAAALGFAVLTGTLFGIYPAWKASRLVPVEALNAE